MWKLLIWAAIIYYAFQYFVKPKSKSNSIDDSQDESIDNNTDDDGFSDYEEIE